MTQSVTLKPLQAIPRGADTPWLPEWTIPVRISSWDCASRMEGAVERHGEKFALRCFLRYDNGVENVYKLPNPDPSVQEGVNAIYLPSLEACVATMEDMRREWLDDLLEPAGANPAPNDPPT